MQTGRRHGGVPWLVTQYEWLCVLIVRVHGVHGAGWPKDRRFRVVREGK